MARMFRVVVVVVVLGACLMASAARASLIVDRNAKHPTLKVDRNGRALVQYARANGRRINAVVRGAVNGIANEKLASRQTVFEVD